MKLDWRDFTLESNQNLLDAMVGNREQLVDSQALSMQKALNAFVNSREIIDKETNETMNRVEQFYAAEGDKFAANIQEAIQ